MEKEEGIERLLQKKKIKYQVFKASAGDRWYQPSKFSGLFSVSYVVSPAPRTICVLNPYDFLHCSDEPDWGYNHFEERSIVGMGIGTTKHISETLEKVMENLGIYIIDEKNMGQIERKFRSELGEIRRKWGKMILSTLKENSEKER